MDCLATRDRHDSLPWVASDANILGPLVPEEQPSAEFGKSRQAEGDHRPESIPASHEKYLVRVCELGGDCNWGGFLKSLPK